LATDAPSELLPSTLAELALTEGVTGDVSNVVTVMGSIPSACVPLAPVCFSFLLVGGAGR